VTIIWPAQTRNENNFLRVDDADVVSGLELSLALNSEDVGF